MGRDHPSYERAVTIVGIVRPTQPIAYEVLAANYGAGHVRKAGANAAVDYSDDDTLAVLTSLEEGRQAQERIVVVEAGETHTRRRQSVYVTGRERLHRAG